jgi:hypothetical protein
MEVISRGNKNKGADPKGQPYSFARRGLFISFVLRTELTWQK